MRIVNRKEFLKQPPGTLFSKYEPCVFGELMIKGDSLCDDFFHQDISTAIDCNDSGEFADKLFDSEENGTEIDMDFDCQGRDGCFEENQLFAIWSDKDRNGLINRLEKINLT